MRVVFGEPSLRIGVAICRVIYYNSYGYLIRRVIRLIPAKQPVNQQTSTPCFIQENLKSLITEILFNNTAYDCMPINSSMSSIDKSVSLIEAINIFVSEDIEELLVWD